MNSRDRLNYSDNQQLLNSDNKRRYSRSQMDRGSYDQNKSPNDRDYYEPRPERKVKELKEHTQLRTQLIDHTGYLQDKIYTTCYPLGSKISQTFKSIFRKGDTYVQILEETKKIVEKDIPDDKPSLPNKILQLKINEISNQELDPNLSHPFVRAHIVNMKNGIYVQKSKNDRDCIIRGESLAIFDETKKEYESYKNDLIYSFATNCVDLREAGGARARWNETFLINEEIDNILKEDVIILFEVLDFNPKQLQTRDFNNLDQDYYYKVAWGYIRPIGLAKNHFGLSKVQLYKYIFDSQKLNPKQRRHFIPLVYFDFIWPNKTNYDGFLSVQVSPIDVPPEIRVPYKAMNVFEIESEDHFYDGTKYKDRLKDQAREYEDEILDKEKEKGRRIREPNKPCIFPDRLMKKFISAELGCFRLSFSPNGKILAAACTKKNGETIIKFYDVDESFAQIYQYRGHTNLIHCLDWMRSTQNYTLLSTSSSDFSNKIWKVPFYSQTDEYIDEDDSEEYYLSANIHHPSYVYCSKFYPLRKGSSNLLLVTGCFDSYIRFFFVNQEAIGQKLECQHKILISQGGEFEQYNNLLDHRHPNCIEFDSQSLMFVGDSLGLIHLYIVTSVLDDPRSVQKQRIIENSNLKGDPISQLHYIQNKKYLIVHSRNNCIWNIEIQNKPSITNKYIGSSSSKFPVHSCISPDEIWILSGSEDGKLHLWGLEDRGYDDYSIRSNLDRINSLEYNIDGIISDVSWNNTYHMIAVCGFGKDHPISVYYFEKETDITLAQYRDLKDKLDQQEKMRMQFDLDQEYQQDPYDPKANRQYQYNYYSTQEFLDFLVSCQLQYQYFYRIRDIMQKKKYSAKLLQLFFYSKELSQQSLLFPSIETGYPTKQLKQSILDMKKTAYVYQLPYLASNQIGIEKNIVVFSKKIVEKQYYDSEYIKFDTYLNPKITKISNQTLIDFEECQSTIGIESQVVRHSDILIQYMDEEGNSKEEEMNGFKSRLFQQAIDLQSGKLPIKWNISRGKNRVSEKFLELQNAKIFQSALEQYNQAIINYLSSTEIAPNYFDRSLDSLNIPKEINNKRFSIKDETYDIHEKQFIEEIQELQEELVEFVELNKLPRRRVIK
ncbi:hypothetical protein ABPG72_011558 [Tetrahymena utriculariae]